MMRPVRTGDPKIVRLTINRDACRYDVVIGRGVLAELGRRIIRLRPGATAVVVCDAHVAKLHWNKVRKALSDAGVKAKRIVVPAGEASKSWRRLNAVCNELLTAKIERGDIVVALGGGVVGDLAGFAAAIVRRGLALVQVPTTLLAQVDSSLGGKTGVNSAQGKNQIGAFYQPILVIADTALLDSLRDRDFRAGYAEVVKYGLIDNADFFSWLEKNWKDVFAGGPAREKAIATSCEAKARIVKHDERETGAERHLLNLGHTFGHALEAAAGFSRRLLHGEAVAIGLALAFAFSERRGLLAPAEVERVVRHLKEVGLPTRIADIPGKRPRLGTLMKLMAQDKKVHRGKLTFILARGIGRARVVRNVDVREVRAFLAKKLAER
jgi:3-dehydroquinate synthase